MEEAPSHFSLRELPKSFLTKSGQREPYFTQELPSHRSLKEILDDPDAKKSFPQKERLLLLVQACTLLDYCHKQGVIHRDVKPEHLLLTEEGALYLGGFALAKVLGGEDLSSPDLVGTPGYMPPEQIRREEDAFEPRSDLFSLGVILYELLCEQRPFTGANLPAVLLATLEREPLPLTLRAPWCPASLEALCLSLLQKSPQKRPESAGAVGSALAACLEELQELSSASEHAEQAKAPREEGALEESQPPTEPSREDVGSAPSQGADLTTVNPACYEIERELARGGLGKVLLARDTRLGRPVAVKELLRDQGQARARFLQEALLTARLQHPGIVPVYEAGRWSSGEPFYSMKLVSGRPLHDLIKEAGTLSERLSLLPHVLAAAEAIAYAHQQKIIHRDVKPQNIMVGELGETVVIDWGLAKDLNEQNSALELPAGPYRSAAKEGLTQEGEVMGTPAYMPIEQARGEPVDERADVYALGAILYALLSGGAPYQGESNRQVLLKLLEAPPPPLEEKEPQTPPDLLAIVKKATQREASARYPTARELAEDLRRFQTGQIVGAYQYSALEHVKRFLQKHRAAFSVAALLSAVFLVLGAYGLFRIIEAEQVAQQERQQAEDARANAEIARAEAVKSLDTLTLEQAKIMLERDPAETIRLLSTLSQDFTGWSTARMLAAEAVSRGVPRVLRGHTEGIHMAVYSPDGKTLASASRDHTIRLWTMPEDDQSGAAQSLVLRGHQDVVRYVLFSQDGKTLFSSDDSGEVRRWDLSLPDPQSQLLTRHEGDVYALALSPDGRLLASAGRDTQIHLTDLKSGQSRSLSGHTKAVMTLAFSPDGSLLASGGIDADLRLWELATGEAHVLSEHQGSLLSLAFSPDGKKIASASADRTVRLWELSGNLSSPLGVIDEHEGPVWTVLFSPDGSLLASTGEAGVIHVQTLEGALPPKPARRFTGHEGGVLRLAFSPDGKTLASASSDGSVGLFSLALGRMRALRGHKDFVRSVAFSPDGKTLASASFDGTLRLWSLAEFESRVFMGSTSPITFMEISPDGKKIASGAADGTILLWDTSSWEHQTLGTHQGMIVNLKFSPDSKRLASSGFEDNVIKLWDLETHKGWQIGTQEGSSSIMAFSPDGRRLASVSIDHTIRLWDLAADPRHPPYRLLEAKERDLKFESITFSLDGGALALTSGRSLYFWHLKTGAYQHLPLPGPGFDLRLSPDGSALAIWGYYPSIEIQGLTPTGALSTEHRSLQGHKDNVLDARFSPDGEWLASGSQDDTVRLWSLATGESYPLYGHTATVTGVAFLPDGAHLASSGQDSTLQVFPVVIKEIPAGESALRAWLGARAQTSDDRKKN